MPAQPHNASARSQQGLQGRHRIVVVPLLLEGLALALVLTGLIWAIVTIGSQSVATTQTTHSQVTQARPHTTTSRQPGAGHRIGIIRKSEKAADRSQGRS